MNINDVMLRDMAEEERRQRREERAAVQDRTMDDYEREIRRRLWRRRRDRFWEIVGGLVTAGVVVALMYMIAKYTPSQFSAERDALAAEEGR